MAWILRMAWRDTRGSRSRLIVFLSSIVFGVAAIVAINGFGENLKLTLDEEARGLLGADLSIESNKPFDDETEALVDSIGGEQARQISLTSMAAFPSTDLTRLVSVRALKGAYPFYGRVETEPSSAARDYQREGGAIVDAGLMDQVGVEVGDSVQIGGNAHVIRGRLIGTSRESAAVMVFSPRIFIRYDDLDPALLERGSRAEYEIFFRLPPATQAQDVLDSIKPHLDERRLGSDTVEEIKENWDDALSNLYRFLGLVALTALLLGGLGVGSAVHLYVRRRLDTVAVLRCLGARRATTSAVYVVQALGLGIVGSATGCVLGIALQAVIPLVLSEFLPGDVPFAVSLGALAAGMLIGVTVTLVFALFPLSEISDVSPLAALRQAYEGQTSGWRLRRISLLLFVGAAVVAISVFQASQPIVGIAYAAGLMVVFGGLAAVGALIVRVARKILPRRAPYVLRQGVANLHRPHNQTSVLTVSLGLGTFVILVMVFLHATLLRQIQIADEESLANVVMFDVQEDQLSGIGEVINGHGLQVLDEVPIVAMRLESVRGESIESMILDSTRQASWAHRREYRSTYRNEIVESERLIAGAFTGRAHPDAEAAPVSVERDIANELGVQLGDTLVWNVQGLLIPTTVGSIREVNWNRLSANFFVVFPEGILEEAPKTFVVLTRTPTDDASARLQRDLVRAFPTVSVIDLALVLDVFEKLYARASFVIRFMALFSVLTGLLVLTGAVLATRFERTRESVLLKALGAARKQVMRIMLVEYAAIGIVASLAGGLMATLGAGALATFVFRTPLAVPYPSLLLMSVFIVGLTVAIGMITSRATYQQPVMAVLRAEG